MSSTTPAATPVINSWRDIPIVHVAITRLRWLLWRFSGKPRQDRYASFSKRASLAEVADRFACTSFVETGTYLGDTVAAMRGHFAKVISIELSQALHERALRRFRRCSNVVVLQGDSSQRLKDALQLIEGRALFWLDGHYSGDITAKGELECPVLAELDAISTHSRSDHVIIIDDARCFGRDADYPTIDTVMMKLAAINQGYLVEIVEDSIRAFPPNVSQSSG